MSLLRRISEGNGEPTQSVPETNNKSAKNVKLQTRRVAAPGVGSQKDTYTDLKN